VAAMFANRSGQN